MRQTMIGVATARRYAREICVRRFAVPVPERATAGADGSIGRAEPGAMSLRGRYRQQPPVLEPGELPATLVDHQCWRWQSRTRLFTSC